MANIIKQSIKKLFFCIRNNKKIFLCILILQAFFIASLLYINLLYLMPIITKSMEINELLERENLDDKSISINLIQQKPTLENAMLIGQNYIIIKDKLKYLIIFSTAAYIIINSLIWHFSISLTEDSSSLRSIVKNFFIYFYRFFILNLGFLILLFLMLIPNENSEKNYYLIIIVSVILIYFLYVGNTLLSKIKIKDIHKKIFKIAILKVHFVFFAILIIIAINFGAFGLLFFSIEYNIYLMILSTLVVLIIIVLSRLFFILFVNELRQR